jgi:hypothetical protein
MELLVNKELARISGRTGEPSREDRGVVGVTDALDWVGPLQTLDLERGLADWEAEH